MIAFPRPGQPRAVPSCGPKARGSRPRRVRLATPLQVCCGVASSSVSKAPQTEEQGNAASEASQGSEGYSGHELYGRLYGAPGQLPPWAGHIGAYTPFEYVEFGDAEILHDVEVTVHAPLGKVFAVWRDRANYAEWFDLIGQMVLHPHEPAAASYFLFYSWGKLPALELYMTLEREMADNEYIVERSVDGMELSACALFREVDSSSTAVALRVAYYMPLNLQEFVGPAGIWGDVNAILEENMQAMKEFVEGVDAVQLATLRDEDRLAMDEQPPQTLLLEPQAASASAPAPAEKKPRKRRPRKASGSEASAAEKL
ncbi:hypothetical protein WJX81_006452 [Elliptochloris bilobata]|uniref:Coenzyme Q-binding protein COQ10 START domain-containing protein n=1 Tax=Elliptochloris bilobata TaxID=381761 RepID=A0AAW1S122_9CHLO